MTASRQSAPPVVFVYGLLGLIPFLAPPLAGIFIPDAKPISAKVLALYGALILSFLGGARWGLAIVPPKPSAGIISLAMLPTLAGLALLVLPASDHWIQLPGLAAALALQWSWDASSANRPAANLPAWYPRLRTILSTGAIIGLLVGAAVFT